jgi:hypothetical protein
MHKFYLNEVDEVELLMKSLNFDEEEGIETDYFIRRLERTGGLDDLDSDIMSKDEKILREPRLRS